MRIRFCLVSPVFTLLVGLSQANENMWNGDSQIALTKLAANFYHEDWTDSSKNHKLDVFENPQAHLSEQVEDLRSQMNIEEKTCQLVTLHGYQRVTRDDLPTPRWKNEFWKIGLANIGERINCIPG